MFLNKLHEKKRVPSQLYEVVTVASGKGCIGRTSAYEVFFWEGSTMLENLLGAIAIYADSKEPVQIWVVPNSRKKEGFELDARLGSEGFWRIGSDRWEFLEEEPIEGNPLLITKQSTYSPVIDTSDPTLTEAALKVSSSFGGRIVPQENSTGIPEPSRPQRANDRKKG